MKLLVCDHLKTKSQLPRTREVETKGDLCKLEASLVYTVSSRLSKAAE